MVNIGALVKGVVLGIVAIIVTFLLVGNLAPTITTSANNISNSGLPLANLFASNGVVLIIFMVAVLIGVIVLAFNMMKHK